MLVARRLGPLISVQQPAPLGLLLVLLLLYPAAGRMLLDRQLPLFLSLLAPPVCSCWELPTVLGPSRPLLTPLRVITKSAFRYSGSFIKILPKNFKRWESIPSAFSRGQSLAAPISGRGSTISRCPERPIPQRYSSPFVVLHKLAVMLPHFADRRPTMFAGRWVHRRRWDAVPRER